MAIGRSCTGGSVGNWGNKTGELGMNDRRFSRTSRLCWLKAERSPRAQRYAQLLSAFCALFLCILSLLTAGCSASSYPAVGTISFPNGAVSSVSPGTAIALSADVSNDPKGLGVNWVATCTPYGTTTVANSGTVITCGTFSPTHTASGVATNYTAPNSIPVGGTVTVTATSEEDPTRAASVTLTISGQPLAITITPATANIGVSGNAQFIATVANDAANAGVTWTLSCGQDTGILCGGFDPALATQKIQLASGAPLTYYAPTAIPSSVVTLTATSVTNNTVSAAASVTIVPDITVSFLVPPPTSLSPGATASLNAVVENDTANAGVTWSATCAAGGNACGSFSVAQTASDSATVYTAPTGSSTTSVTVTATSVTDPTKSISATISIGSTGSGGITVAISSAPPSLSLNGTANISAIVFGDSASAGVNWTATAGTFNPAQTPSGVPTTYTAPSAIPSGGKVTITATSVTDPTKSASVSLGFNTSISVSIAPASTTVQIGLTAGFVATVTNDSANGGVTWTATAGTFSLAQTASGAATTYTAPNAAGTVTITATSVTNPAVSATAIVTVSTQAQPIAVQITPATASLTPGGSARFTATVSNDSANAGVTWTATDGTLSPTQTASGAVTTYTAPNATGTVIVTATSVTDPTKSATVQVTIASAGATSSNSLLMGQYAISMTGLDGDGGNYESYAGSITADGSGNIISGEMDLTSPESLSNTTLNIPNLTGTYSLSANGHGSITVSNSSLNYSLTLSVTMVSASHAVVMSEAQSGYQPQLVVNGSMDLQTVSSFTTPLNGSFAFTYSEPDGSSGPYLEGGVMTVSSGKITNYLVDENIVGVPTIGQRITANDSFGVPDTNGRGMITLTDFLEASGVTTHESYVYYIVDSNHFILEGTNAAGLGKAYQAPAAALSSLAGSYAFTEQGFDVQGNNWIDAGGVFTCNTSGQLTAGTLDVNSQQVFTTTSGTPLAGTCALDSPADGRGTLNITNGTGDVSSFAVYPTASDGVLMMELDTMAEGTGAAYTQAAGVSASTFSGSYALNLQSWYNLDFSVMLNGIINAAGTAALTGTADISDTGHPTYAPAYAISGNMLTDTGSGRLTGDIPTGVTGVGDTLQLFYVVDANTVLSLEDDNGNDTGTGLLQLQTFTGAGAGASAIGITISPATASLAASGTTTLTATVTNDSANGGVTWSATCAAGANACGTFSPTQTASGAATTYTAPGTGGPVNIIATSVTNPSTAAIAAVSVAGTPPIAVTISPTTASLITGGTTTFTATVANDTSTNPSVTWTATAGSFSPTQTASGTQTTYTAPSSAGTVTVTATSVTDATKKATATVTVTTTAPPISVTVSPATASAVTGGTVSFTATVANDSANGGVNWTATAGSISPTQTASGVPTTFTAPGAAGTVTVTATSVTDPTKSATATVTVSAALPISVSISPATASVTAGGTTSLIATVSNDSANGGVNWTATAGSFSPTQTASGIATTFTAPSTAESVTITATSVTDSTKSATATITVTAATPNSVFNGQYAFALTGLDTAGGVYQTYVGSLTADGSGNITAGEVDFSEHVTSLTGTYSLNSSGHGTITLQNTAELYTQTLSVTMVSPTHGVLMADYASGQKVIASGSLDQQTASSFSTALSGSFAFTYSEPAGSGGANLEGGVMAIADGVVTHYLVDENIAGTVTAKQASSASDGFSSADANGRGTITLSGFLGESSGSYVYYMVDSTHFILQNTDGTGQGVVYQEPSTALASLAGSYAFTERGFVTEGNNWIDAGGVFTCNATALTAGTLDVNNEQAFTTTSGTPLTGTCALDSPADGRGVLNITNGTGGVSKFALYPTASHGLLMMELDTAAVGAGAAYTQATGVSASTFTGTYAVDLQSWYHLDFALMMNGTVTAAGTTALTGSADISSYSSPDYTAAYSITSGAITDTGNGRLTGDIPSNVTEVGDMLQIFYVVNAGTVLSLESDNNNDTSTAIFQLQTLP